MVTLRFLPIIQNLLRLTNQYINKKEAGACPELPGFSRTENR